MSRNILGFFSGPTDEDYKEPTKTYVMSDEGDRVDLAPDAATFDAQKIRVVFFPLERELLTWLEGFDAVVGCVAWLTNTRLLSSLNKKSYCQVIMQKEDWLRPDGTTSHPGVNLNTRECYRRRAGFDRSELQDLAGLSYLSDPMLERYRVFGINGARTQNPVMHHKFLVGCDATERNEAGQLVFKPKSVWAGSFNMTGRSVRNLDSAIIMGSEPASVYYKEWRDAVMFSEPLDFNANYVCPEWRLGT